MCYVDESGKLKSDQDNWVIRLVGKSGNDVKLGITPSSECMIGEWTFSILTTSFLGEEETPETLKYLHNDEITILLNPWCKSKNNKYTLLV